MTVLMYSKPSCARCQRAKSYFKRSGVAYRELLLDVDYTRDELLSKFPAVRQFPVLVKDGVEMEPVGDLFG